MLALARYTLKGPYNAASIVGILAVLAVFLPLLIANQLFGVLLAMLLTYLSASLVGLIILTQGIKAGVKAILVSILGITLISTLLLRVPTLGISIGLLQWLPVILLAQTLRLSKSIAMTLLVGLVPGAVAIFLQYTIWPDLQADWLAVVGQSLKDLPQNPNFSSAEISEQLDKLTHWVLLALVGSIYMLFVSIVLMARWLQARLAGSDGFRQEFLALALGKPASLVALGLLALSLSVVQDWLSSLAILVAAAFLFQGIAVIHTKLQGSQFKSILTGLFYALLMILPQVMAITVITGLIDNWLLLRQHKGSKDTPDE